MVEEEGGYDTVTAAGRWPHVACNRMNMPNLVNKSYGSVLKGHYEKYLYSYDLFEAGLAYDIKAAQKALGKQSADLKKSPKKVSLVSFLQHNGC